jgi:molybdopterin synthase catalytic subunit
MSLLLIEKMDAVKADEAILSRTKQAMDFCEIRIVRETIAIPSPEPDEFGCGAIVDFFGIVRPLEDGRRIVGIDYEAHPRMAESELRAIVSEAAENHDLRACRLVHRVGFVPAGEISLFLRVGTPHREMAFTVNRELVEALKARVPIWKKPIFIDATMLC